MLHEFQVNNMIIDSKVKEVPSQNTFLCFVAMVETLNNRLKEGLVHIDDIGLVIIDEAHYNSFTKLFKFFHQCNILGVTATPLSSSIKLPMNENYKDLIVGESISTLIGKGFLAKPLNYRYDVGLTSLKVGVNGDYTVSSSERLYTSYGMLDKLMRSYEERSKGKKTLIFNNGINTSKQVYYSFIEAGYEIRHLDNSHSPQERREILSWFRKKNDAILTSVSILTTGFDEPAVETIILNRATKSLTLYFQMIGRGSRKIPSKDAFNIIDLGNNIARFGPWDGRIDWQKIFKNPDAFYQNLMLDEEIERQFKYIMPHDLRAQFSKSESVEFDIMLEYDKVVAEGLKPMTAVDRSIEQHARICIENGEDLLQALQKSRLLEHEIAQRIKSYSYCIAKSTLNFKRWLMEDYRSKLKKKIMNGY